MVERMAKEYGPEAGPDGDPINVQTPPRNVQERPENMVTQDGVQIGDAFYKFKQVPISDLIAMMADLLLKDVPINWSETAYPEMEQNLKKDSFSNLTFGTFASEINDFTGIFRTNDPFLIELDIPWDQTQWAGMEEKFVSGENLELRFSEIDEDPPVVQEQIPEIGFTDAQDRLDEDLARLEEDDFASTGPGNQDSYPYAPGESNMVSADALYEMIRSVGFTPEEAVTMVAISRAESGFNARATNMVAPDNSYGLFQINMIGNLGQARERIYKSNAFRQKYNLSTEWQGYETLLDPRWNVAAAHHTYEEALGMNGYQQYDNPGFGPWSVYTTGNPPPYEQYLPIGELARSGSIRDGDGSGSPPIPNPGGTDETGIEDISAEDVYTLLEEQFGGAAYFFQKNKQDMRIGILADGSPTSYRDPDAVDYQDITEYLVENDITALTRVSGLLKLTEWWQTTDVAMRTFDIAVADMNDLMLQEYLEPTIDVLRKEAQFLGIQLEESELFDLAKNLKRFGDSEDAEAIRIAMAGQLRYQNTISEISAFQANIDNVQKEAYKYFTPMDDEAAQEWAELLYTGEATEVELDQFLKAGAVARFPTLDKVINEMGVTPAQYFSPYKYQIEQMLGRSNIDLLEEFPDVIEYIPESGSSRPMSLSEVRTFVRGLPEWQQSEDAKSQARALAFSIGQTFGEVA